MRVIVCGRPPESGGSAPHDSRHSMVAGTAVGAGAGTALGGGGAGVTGGAEDAVGPAALLSVRPPAQALVTTPSPVAPASRSALRRLKSFADLSNSDASMAVTIGQFRSRKPQILQDTDVVSGARAAHLRIAQVASRQLCDITGNVHCGVLLRLADLVVIGVAANTSFVRPTEPTTDPGACRSMIRWRISEYAIERRHAVRDEGGKMSSQLPPSKFGAGTTYGEPGQPHALRQTPTSPPAPPPPPAPAAPSPYPATPDPYGQTAAYQAPLLDPYSSTYQMPGSVAPPQFPTANSYSNPVSAGARSLALVTPSGSGGAAITAAILSLIGAAWYGWVIIDGLEAIKYMFSTLSQLSAMGADGWYYGSVAAVIARCVVVPLLLLGGVLLLTRSSMGRVMVIMGSLLTIAVNGYETILVVKAVSNGTKLGDAFAATYLPQVALPLVLAIVVLMLAMSSSAKRWCQRATGYAAPATY